MKITGERVVTPEGGFNPTWQRHVAAYALCEQFLPPAGADPGRVLDLGCGVGHSYHLFAPRVSVGLDIDPAALVGQNREIVVADMRELPFEDESFASVISVHSLEHVPEPDLVVAEVARVLSAEGVAIFVTPNRLTFGRPDEIVDPYHHVEFDPSELRELCAAQFAEFEIRGIFGSARYMEIFDEERVTLDRMLGRDPLKLRRLVPLTAKRRLYDAMLRRHRRNIDPRAAAIGGGDFALHQVGLKEALDLCAVCRRQMR